MATAKDVPKCLRKRLLRYDVSGDVCEDVGLEIWNKLSAEPLKNEKLIQELRELYDNRFLSTNLLVELGKATGVDVSSFTTPYYDLKDAKGNLTQDIYTTFDYNVFNKQRCFEADSKFADEHEKMPILLPQPRWLKPFTQQSVLPGLACSLSMQGLATNILKYVSNEGANEKTFSYNEIKKEFDVKHISIRKVWKLEKGEHIGSDFYVDYDASSIFQEISLAVANPEGISSQRALSHRLMKNKYYAIPPNNELNWKEIGFIICSTVFEWPDNMVCDNMGVVCENTIDSGENATTEKTMKNTTMGSAEAENENITVENAATEKTVENTIVEAASENTTVKNVTTENTAGKITRNNANNEPFKHTRDCMQCMINNDFSLIEPIKAFLKTKEVAEAPVLGKEQIKQLRKFIEVFWRSDNYDCEYDHDMVHKALSELELCSEKKYLSLFFHKKLYFIRA